MHLVNGEPESQVCLLDRGLLYGHSVFETIAVHKRRPLLLESHLSRLERGCQQLHIPCSLDLVRQDIDVVAGDYASEDCVLRVTLTMGVGGRGYLSPQQGQGTRIVSAHPKPERESSNWTQGIVLGKVKLRLADQPALAGIKHGNRLEQVLARFEWQPGWQEAIVLGKKKRVIEATQSNVFLVKNGQLLTPDLSRQGVAGVMREYIIQIAARELGITCRLMRLSMQDLLQADELFVTNSLIGLWPVKQFKTRQFSSFSVSKNLLNTLIKNEVIPPI